MTWQEMIGDAELLALASGDEVLIEELHRCPLTAPLSI